MVKRKTIYTKLHVLSSILMLLALTWLTVSTPFVYASNQVKKEIAKKSSEKATDDNNTASNTTEEKTENGTNTLSEYLHDLTIHDYPSTIIVKFYKCHPSNLYFAYHPELVSPPPEA